VRSRLLKSVIMSIARQLFQQAIQQLDQPHHLERAALCVALEEYPDVDVEEYVAALDVMAAEAEERLPVEPYPLKIIQTINHYLYEDLGFQGNVTQYYDPRNSFLNQVIDRRLGIPITLSLVYLAIAQRLQFPMVGIGMPGHFLIRPVVGDMDIYVDPFNQGEILFQQDCRDRLEQLFQKPLDSYTEFLQPVSSRQLLARILTNLKVIYINHKELSKAVAAIDRILLLFPDAPIERRDRGVLKYQLGQFNAARDDLEAYLLLAPTANDRTAVRQLLNRIPF